MDTKKERAGRNRLGHHSPKEMEKPKRKPTFGRDVISEVMLEHVVTEELLKEKKTK